MEFNAGACAEAKDDPTAYRNPLLISAVAGTMKLCAEVSYTGRIIGAWLTQYTERGVDCSDLVRRALIHWLGSADIGGGPALDSRRSKVKPP